MGLTEYHRKRDFKKTREPRGKVTKEKKAKVRSFVIQKHAASHLHYDFRLELDGVLKSWAVPKGPSMNPKDKRLAMQVEDHPIEYGDFEGIIPEGEYGGGTVMLWDQGQWEPLDPADNPHKQWQDGSMKFRLNGERLQGAFALVRMRGGKYGKDDRSWLLIKERDDNVSEKSVTEQYTTSVTTDRSMDEIAGGKKSKSGSGKKKGGLRVWTGTKDADKQTDAVDVALVTGAKKAKFPTSIKPQLATLVKSAPHGPNWVHEIKFDGYRFLALISKGRVELLTRNGNDWTNKFKKIAEAFEHLPVESAIVDGELVAIDENGVTRFQLLQNSLKGMANPALAFYAFDLVYLDGFSLKSASLEDRKRLLQPLLQVYSTSDVIRYSEHFSESGDKVWDQACRMGLEGIISKDLTAGYEEKRSKSWVKVKCSSRQEFVIGGYTDPTGARKGLGALLVGYHDEQGKLVYAGKVGTGFTDATLKELHGRLQKLSAEKSPFSNHPGGSWARRVHWVKPVLVGEVAYTEMTSDGHLRHPSFQGLREDKKPQAVTVEVPASTPSASGKKADSKASAKTASSDKKPPSKKTRTTKSSSSKAPSKKEKAMAESGAGEEVKLTNPQRVLFPDEKFTKQDLDDYYAAVKDHAYPWLTNRPLTLVRCPEGRTKPCFYQRHNKANEMPGIEPVDVEIKDRTEEFIYLADPIGLRTLVQNSTLEIHGWQCKADDLERPDRIIFDIDPSPEVEWKDVVAAAKTVKGVLERCGMETFVMTTGGKGLHVVTPLKPEAHWDEVIKFAEGIAHYLEANEPDRFTANLSKKKRVGKVFVDYLRNNKTASAVLPYSSRAREGATVATPVAWSEVTARLNPAKFTIKTVPKRIKTAKGDPWKEYEKARRPLDYEKVIARLQGSE